MMASLKLRESQNELGRNIVTLSWRVIKCLHLIPYAHWQHLYENLESLIPNLEEKFKDTFQLALSKCKERSLRNRSFDWTVIFNTEGLIDSTSNQPSSQI